MKKVALASIRFYQRHISSGTIGHCRYHPTCSQYMFDAITLHGLVKGTIMGTARILRCHPFVKGGIDYVPLHFTLRRNPDQSYTQYRKGEKKR